MLLRQRFTSLFAKPATNQHRSPCDPKPNSNNDTLKEPSRQPRDRSWDRDGWRGGLRDAPCLELQSASARNDLKVESWILMTAAPRPPLGMKPARQSAATFGPAAPLWARSFARRPWG
eukprot:2045330-Pyramimonas_sp.AAC.1